ncbi:S41 family peptidase [Clostridium autoethanogenum]|uniref:S41 family peptidase n=1 Tax=Clostridium autoethanogenum DSM 10061 TaxID=1341692 RepID=A0ABM5NWI0_9CLOT|nr:S41 family peptidase [Clostridium autoethanogenum]AGY76949.1 S41 family peptidase [Clostridium autoethanogenum DSM 10061]ALU37092.1 Peptidase S41 [Clostridium autoethanogenum DSM 10061]OVY48546.1 Peptidase family S41 [Clostridium autoethanogenum]
MNKFVKLVFGFILFSFAIAAAGCESEYLGGDRNTKWKKDLSYMQKALPKKHVNLFFKINEEKFNDEINTLKNSVDNLNDDEIAAGIYKITASIGDSHTSAYKETLNAYPMEFYYFKEGVYVVNTTSEYKKALYAKLIKINGKDIKNIQEAILPLIVNDNEGMVKKSVPKYLSNPEILHGIKVVSDTNKAVFTFQDSNGKIFNLNVSSMDKHKISEKFIVNETYNSSYPLYMQKKNLNYWYKYLSDEKTVYFKYNKCQSDEDSDKSIEDFIAQMLSFMNTHTVDKFVIDMRDNSGGSDKYIKPIIDWLKNKKLNNKNHLFVIVGRNTFSSAIVDTSLLKKDTNATFVGETTSGKPNHYGAVKEFELPNSKMEISYSTQFNKSSNNNSTTFAPDKIIELSIKDYMNKTDPVLNYILKF